MDAATVFRLSARASQSRLRGTRMNAGWSMPWAQVAIGDSGFEIYSSTLFMTLLALAEWGRLGSII